MNAFLAAIVVLTLLTGCRSTPAGAPTQLEAGYRREGHPAFTPQESAIVTASRRYLEQSRGKRLDAYYRVTHEENHYSVHVLAVHRYEGSQPKFTIARDWMMELGEDGTVRKVLQGH